jgi:hypothetical protein
MVQYGYGSRGRGAVLLEEKATVLDRGKEARGNRVTHP